MRRGLQLGSILAAVALVALLAPGLGDVRRRLAHCDPLWLAAGVVLEVLSCLSYVLMFRPVFCPRMSWRTATELGLSEVGVGSLVPAGGAGGLALGAWALRHAGMPGQQIARRSVAFFLVKSAANFVAVAVVGTLLATGLVGPHLSLALTLLPAALSIAAIVTVLLLPVLLDRLAPRVAPPPSAPRWRRALGETLPALAGGVREARRLIRGGNVAVLLGSAGYWAFDNAVLWATFHAIGSVPAIAAILMGYLLGQLGGLLPLPGGFGGIEGGLLGAMVVYGAPLAAAAAAVLSYRIIQFWVPLLLGLPAFVSLRRGLNRPERPELCA